MKGRGEAGALVPAARSSEGQWSMESEPHDLSRDAERRRKNVRAAWLLAAFALFMALSSVPFWKGLFQMAMGTGQ